MQSDTCQPGQIVTASYKTGEYIGEVIELMSTGKAAVRILAVVKHPAQGDLHNPMNRTCRSFMNAARWPTRRSP